MFLVPGFVECLWKMLVNFSNIFSRSTNLEQRVLTLEKDLEETVANLTNTVGQLSQFKIDNKDLHEEMTVINQVKLFDFKMKMKLLLFKHKNLRTAVQSNANGL